MQRRDDSYLFAKCQHICNVGILKLNFGETFKVLHHLHVCRYSRYKCIHSTIFGFLSIVTIHLHLARVINQPENIPKMYPEANLRVASTKIYSLDVSLNFVGNLAN